MLKQKWYQFWEWYNRPCPLDAAIKQLDEIQEKMREISRQLDDSDPHAYLDYEEEEGSDPY